MLILFAWPYYFLSTILDIDLLTATIGSLFFSGPFAMTVLHGHVTMALGTLHRDNYYYWLEKYPLSYGLLFHPIMFRTRFRLMLLMISFIILGVSFLIP